MGIFSKVGELFSGKVLKDYGELGENMGRKYSLTLVEDAPENSLLIRVDTPLLLGGQIDYLRLDRAAMKKLRDAIDEALAK